MSSLRPHRQSSPIGFYGFVGLLVLAAILTQKARADTGQVHAAPTMEIISMIRDGTEIGQPGRSDYSTPSINAK